MFTRIPARQQLGEDAPGDPLGTGWTSGFGGQWEGARMGRHPSPISCVPSYSLAWEALSPSCLSEEYMLQWRCSRAGIGSKALQANYSSATCWPGDLG